MSHEEEERRKVIVDSQVAGAAARGIALTQQGQLTREQLRAMIELDEEYLSRLEGICPEAVR